MIYIAGALSSPFRDEKKNINPTIELIAFALEKVTNEMKDLELVCSFRHLIEANSGQICVRNY